MKEQRKCLSVFQKCSIRQVYDAVNKAETKIFGMQQYKIIKKSASEYDLNRKKIPSNAIYCQPIAQQKHKPQNKPFPGPGYYFKTQKKTNQIRKKQSQKKKKTLKLDDQSKAKINLGPGSYNVQRFDQFYEKKLQKDNNKFVERPLFSDQSQAKSIEFPSVGQYNVGYVKNIQKNISVPKWQQKSRQQWLVKHKSLQKTLKKRDISPSPHAYSPIPRSYSLFMTELKKPSKGYLIHQKQRRQKSKQNQQKYVLGKIKKNKIKKQVIGPGKYLSLQDWKDKIKDKKGLNFINTKKSLNVYYS